MPGSLPLPTRVPWNDLPGLHPHAAGLASSARALGVAVPPERAAEPVRVVATLTPARHALVAWLGACHVDTGARASPGSSGVPIVARLAPRGRTPSLVHARPVKTVPGRQRDGHDAPGLPQLQALGLWQGSCRPEADRRGWRPLLRPRAPLMAPRAPHLLPRPQALTRMHRQWRAGRTARTGVTGQAIRRALGQGERDPLTLAPWRTPARQSSADDLAQALTGPWRAEQGCLRQHALELFDGSTRQRAACEEPGARPGTAMQPRVESAEPPLPLPRVTPGSTSQHPPRDEARAPLVRLTGGELVAVTGLAASSAQTIGSASGTDRRKCPPVTPGCSWRGLAPRHDSSGGQVVRSRTLPVGKPATHAWRQAAPAGARSASACGASFRALRARLGPQQALVATAHQLARVVDHVLKKREAFTETSAAEETRQRQERARKHLTRRANTLGSTLTQVATSQAASPV